MIYVYMHAKRQNNWEIISGISKSLPMMNNDPFILAFYRENSFMQAGFSGVMTEISRHQPLTMHLNFQTPNHPKLPANISSSFGPRPPPHHMDGLSWLLRLAFRNPVACSPQSLGNTSCKYPISISVATSIRWFEKRGNNWRFCSRLCTRQWIDFSLHPSCFFGVGVGCNTESENHLATLYKASWPRSSWRLLTTLPDMNMYACIQHVFHLPSQFFF